MKILIIAVIVIVVLLIGVGIWFAYISSQPFYKPGMVRTGKRLSAPLTPPTQRTGADTWLVEPGIELAHFADGQGRNVLVVHGGPGAPFSEPVGGLTRLGDQFQFHYYAQRGCGESTRPFDRFESANSFKHINKYLSILGSTLWQVILTLTFYAYQNPILSNSITVFHYLSLPICKSIKRNFC